MGVIGVGSSWTDVFSIWNGYFANKYVMTILENVHDILQLKDQMSLPDCA